MKRLEQDRFVWPRKEAVLKLKTQQLHWLLDDIDTEAMRASDALLSARELKREPASLV